MLCYDLESKSGSLLDYRRIKFTPKGFCDNGLQNIIQCGGVHKVIRPYKPSAAIGDFLFVERKNNLATQGFARDTHNE